MFYGCHQLGYLNMDITDTGNDLNNIFDHIPNNLVICSNNENWVNILYGFKKFIYCVNNLNISWRNNNITNLKKCYKPINTLIIFLLVNIKAIMRSNSIFSEQQLF